MASSMTSQGMFLATAMAVSGTVILITLRLQKSTTQFLVNQIPQSAETLPRSCISSDGKKKEKKGKKGKKGKKKKKVHFAEDVVDPMGNSEEYRRMHARSAYQDYKKSNLDFSNSSPLIKRGGKVQEMPANRAALYNGILRDRVHHRVAYSP